MDYLVALLAAAAIGASAAMALYVADRKAGPRSRRRTAPDRPTPATGRGWSASTPSAGAPCRSCRSPTSPTDHYCPSCGSRLPEPLDPPGFSIR